uniref:Dolichyl-diphosphooligosaccharide--protein glycosyltransferase subunit 2 n=1 Tax=Angiostrongylus cantonensis TaxID=6313 RepID=A0A0K0D2P2_ANGCA
LTDSNPNGEKITQALRSADRLGIKVNKAAFDKLLEASMKADDSPNNLAWVFNAASLLDKPTAAKYFEKIKNLVSQADEVDKRFLQFDGGLFTTSNAIHGILSLAQLQGKVPAITKDQMSLFTNYLLSRKHVFTEKSAFFLLSALGVLVNNHQLVPVTTLLVGPIMADRSKPLTITVCNVFGLPVASSGVRVDITPVGTTKTIVSNLKLTPVKGSPKLYTIPADKLPVMAGFYNVAVKIDSDDKRLIGLTESNILFKISDDITVDDLKVGVLEKDETITGTSLTKVAYLSKLGKTLTADYTKRLYISFSVKRKSDGELIKPSQAFVLFKHTDGSEVFYTADLQNGGGYVVDIYLASGHKDFESLSGKYTASLIIGDALIRTPLNWSFADITLTLPYAAEEVIPKSQRIVYNASDEIRHVFRQPEKRPSVIVSDAFTVICLSPLFLLIVLWLRIGLNFGNMPLSIWTLFFHGGLAVLFTLYFVFWLQLNMFETLKYLAFIGAFTYLSGNRMSLTKNLKSLTSVGPRAIVTWDKAERIRRNGEIWANPDSIVHRLPKHYCKRYWDNLLRDVAPVHYRPPASRLYWDPIRNVEIEAENYPLLVIYPPEADEGLWGGEGVVKGWKESRPYTKKKILPRHWVPRLYFPALKTHVLYSEILDKHMKITVTERALRLIEQNFGLDYYILRTPEIDLASKLGNRLKREMLLTLANNACYLDNDERRNYIMRKYAEFVMPAEEAEWVGLDLNEAARKQQDIEEQQVSEPLKFKYERELVSRLRAGTDLIANEEEFIPKTQESKFGDRLLGKFFNPVAKHFRR